MKGETSIKEMIKSGILKVKTLEPHSDTPTHAWIWEEFNSICDYDIEIQEAEAPQRSPSNSNNTGRSLQSPREGDLLSYQNQEAQDLLSYQDQEALDECWDYSIDLNTLQSPFTNEIDEFNDSYFPLLGYHHLHSHLVFPIKIRKPRTPPQERDLMQNLTLHQL